MGTCSRNSRSKRHDPATQFSFDVSGSLNEFQSADFGDRRLTDRLIQIEDALGGAPAESIQNACDSWASTKATYRFCDNESVKPKEILSAHRQAHHSRLSETDELSVVSDTTYLTFPRHPPKKDLVTSALLLSALRASSYTPVSAFIPTHRTSGVIDQHLLIEDWHKY